MLGVLLAILQLRKTPRFSAQTELNQKHYHGDELAEKACGYVQGQQVLFTAVDLRKHSGLSTSCRYYGTTV